MDSCAKRPKKLTEKQKRFVQEYIKDLNATAAAKRAGYSEKTAYSMGQRLLKNVEVQTAIQKGIEKRQARTEITQDRVLQELAAIAFANGIDYAQIVSGTATLYDTEKLTDRQKAAIISIKQTKDGVEIKLGSKLKALELLGKHLGMFSGEHEALEDEPSIDGLEEIDEQDTTGKEAEGAD